MTEDEHGDRLENGATVMPSAPLRTLTGVVVQPLSPPESAMQPVQDSPPLDAVEKVTTDLPV